MSSAKSTKKKSTKDGKTPASLKVKKEKASKKSTTLNCEELDVMDLKAVIHSEVLEKTLLGHHKKSFDEFTSTGIHQIVTQLFQAENTIINERNKTEEDNKIETIQFTAKFNDVTIDRPTMMSYDTGMTNILTPNLARKHNKNYSAGVNFSMTVVAKAYMHGSGEPIVRTEEIKDFRFASMPIMVGSKLCHTFGASRETLLKLEEDPRDDGGYFIIKGTEWAIDCIESRIFNSPHVFRNIGHGNEITRLEFISKPGDDFENSSSMMIRYLTTGHIYVKFESNIYLKLVEIPFFILFRLLGMTTDKEIIDNIIYGYETELGVPDVISAHSFNILKRAFRLRDPVFGDALFITDQAALLDYFARQIATLHEGGIPGLHNPDEKQVKYLFKNLPSLLDKNFLPHIGLSSLSRHNKLRYLGHLIHKALLVEMRIEEQTDRDSLINKSVLPAGAAFAKSFKTQFNIAIVQPIKKKLTKDFKSMPFSQVPLAQSVKSAVHGLDLERALIQAITTGNKEITMMNRQVTNRLASEILHRKNQTNVISTGRIIRAPNTSASKQDARADEMRRVHPSYTGYICPAQSADTGEQVGMVKQMAVTASISSASSSEMLKNILRADPILIPLEKCFPEFIHKHNLCKVMVNGDWIGCVQHSPVLFYKYRELRRGWSLGDGGRPVKLDSPGIDPLTTIHWNTRSNELGFWVSDGRMLRPLLIVRNNTELDPIGVQHFGHAMNPRAAVDKTGFVQDVLISTDDIFALRSGTTGIVDLHNQSVVEYISPQELEKCYVAKSLDDLRTNARNPLKQFTHCEIPQALIGIPALTCPMANSNPCARTTFQTNQVKQTCGWYALNWPFRVDKHAFLQYYCETPIVTTMANNYVYPNGINAIVAIASYGGFNQEDSLCINKSAAERGLYEGLHFSFTKTELENGEHFGNPDEAHTIDIKKHANYSLLRDGMVKRGQMIKKDDVIIGKYFTISKPTDHRTYKDMSVVYTSSEPAIVDLVIRARNEEDKEFCCVKYSSVRRLSTGHKFSSRSGQKGMTGIEYDQADMPFTASGMIPDLILNPHSMPSRMTINQLLEGVVAKLCAMLGVQADATIFTKLNFASIAEGLESLGFNFEGTEPMFCGMTGEWIDTDIFISPCFYQRLQKFAEDSMYSISAGPTDVLTRQSIEGKSNQGGLRIGEMEKDCLFSSSQTRFAASKLLYSTDSFDIYVCRRCGKRAVVNERKGIIICKICRDEADIAKVHTTWSSKLFMQELESMNVGVRLKLKPFQYEQHL